MSTPAARAGPTFAARDGWYRSYVLFVPVMVSAFKYVDRQIVTVLASALKADLRNTDAQIGLQVTTQDLVVPRPRGTGLAGSSLGANIFGLGFGLYTAWLISDVTGSLRVGIICTLAVPAITLATLVYADRRLPQDEAVARETPF